MTAIVAGQLRTLKPEKKIALYPLGDGIVWNAMTLSSNPFLILCRHHIIPDYWYVLSSLGINLTTEYSIESWSVAS